MIFPAPSGRAFRWALAVATAAVALGGCGVQGIPSGPSDPNATTPPAAVASGSRGPLSDRTAAPAPGTRPERVSPLTDLRGLHPGLTPVAGPDEAGARARIATLPEGPRGPSAGYERKRDFGAAWKDDVDITWGHDGCPTREEILHRDLKGLDFRAGTQECVVLGGILQEPYTGRTIEFSKSRPMEVQIDHVIPLSYAWHQGARRWSQGRREQLANDPLNLLAVDGPSNQSKSDSGPADWMPPNRRVRCAYAVRFGAVARKYALTVTFADRRAMLRACRT